MVLGVIEADACADVKLGGCEGEVEGYCGLDMDYSRHL